MTITTNTTRRSAMIRHYVDPDADGQPMPEEDQELLLAINEPLIRLDELMNTWLTSHGTDCECEPCIAFNALQHSASEAMDAMYMSLPDPVSPLRGMKDVLKKARSKKGK